jgi:hypothetical protein
MPENMEYTQYIHNKKLFYLVQTVTYKYLDESIKTLHEGPFLLRPPYQAETEFKRKEIQNDET